MAAHTIHSSSPYSFAPAFASPEGQALLSQLAAYGLSPAPYPMLSPAPLASDSLTRAKELADVQMAYMRRFTPWKAQHVEEVAAMYVHRMHALALAQGIPVGAEDQERWHYTGLLHDIGQTVNGLRAHLEDAPVFVELKRQWRALLEPHARWQKLLVPELNRPYLSLEEAIEDASLRYITGMYFLPDELNTLLNSRPDIKEKMYDMRRHWDADHVFSLIQLHESTLLDDLLITPSLHHVSFGDGSTTMASAYPFQAETVTRQTISYSQWLFSLLDRLQAASMNQQSLTSMLVNYSVGFDHPYFGVHPSLLRESLEQGWLLTLAEHYFSPRLGSNLQPELTEPMGWLLHMLDIPPGVNDAHAWVISQEAQNLPLKPQPESGLDIEHYRRGQAILAQRSWSNQPFCPHWQAFWEAVSNNIPLQDYVIARAHKAEQRSHREGRTPLGGDAELTRLRQLSPAEPMLHSDTVLAQSIRRENARIHHQQPPRPDWQEIPVTELLTMAREAGKQMLDTSIPLQTETKPDQSIVTNVDKALNHWCIQQLQHLTPHIPVIAEESLPETNRAIAAQHATFWVIDPVDGTSQYHRWRQGDLSADGFSINIALVSHGEPVFGVTYFPAKGLLYYNDAEGAWKQQDGQPANPLAPSPLRYMETVQTSAHPQEIANLLLDMPTSRHSQNQPMTAQLRSLEAAAGNHHVGYGSAGFKWWDTASVHAVLKAVGGTMITPHNGEELRYPQGGDPNAGQPPHVSGLEATLRQLGLTGLLHRAAPSAAQLRS